MHQFADPPGSAITRHSRWSSIFPVSGHWDTWHRTAGSQVVGKAACAHGALDAGRLVKVRSQANNYGHTRRSFERFAREVPMNCRGVLSQSAT
jgi:hypothetical protein